MTNPCPHARGADDATYMVKMTGSGVLSNGRNEDGRELKVYPLAETVCEFCGCPTLYAMGTPRPRSCGTGMCDKRQVEVENNGPS